MTIDATPSGPNSNSYVDVAGANTYFSERLHTDVWDDLDSVLDKEKALIWATRILDRLAWLGSLPNDTQALRWPRSYVINLDNVYYDNTVIPAFLVHATCEMAIELSGSDKTADNPAEQLKALAVGPIKLDFNMDYVKEIFPETVKEIIAHAIGGSIGVDTMRILRA